MAHEPTRTALTPRASLIRQSMGQFAKANVNSSAEELEYFGETLENKVTFFEGERSVRQCR